MVIMYRWFAGRPLDGKRRTNCTALRAGTRARGDVPLNSWAFLPGWKRSAVRQALLVGIPAVVWGYLTNAGAVLALGVLVLLVLLGLVGRSVAIAVRDWDHNRRYIRPLHLAMSYLLDLPPNTKPGDYIEVPLTFATDETTPAKVQLPAHFSASKENQAAAGGLLLQKLGLSEADMTVEFRTVGRPLMVAKQAPKPPAAVLLADVLHLIDACEPGEIFLGLGNRGAPFKVKFPTESPHWAMSCESGTGKSALLQMIVAQVIRQHPDNRATCIDPKIASLPGLVGVPGVLIVNDPFDIPAMWMAVKNVADEVMRRAGVLAVDRSAEFPMHLLVIDEVNLLAGFSGPVWEKIKPKGEKGKAPIWADLLTCLAAGRQFNVHVVIVGQDMRESALGGIGLRAMLGLRGIAGYDAQMWNRFIQTRPVAALQTGAGRWLYRVNGVQQWVQNVYAGEDQLLHDFARGGRHAAPMVVPGTGTEGLIVGLLAGAAQCGLNVEAFKKRRTRAEGIPGETRVGNQPAWSPEALAAFTRATDGVKG